MGIICIFAGILFFTNPSIRMLDYLPDVIGCILIIIGTSGLSCIDGRIASGRKYATYYLFVSAAKLPLSLYIALKAKDYLLPATFIFSILECILMIGIFVSLIGGLEYLSSRENCESRHFKNSENASVICFAFSIARAVISFAPELFSLGTQKDSFDYTFSPTPEQEAALLKPYAEVLAFVIIFIFGIYFAVVCGKYLLGLFRDSDFRNALMQRYRSYLSENVDTVNLKRVRCAMVLFFFALLFMFNQLLDSVNIIPNTLAYIFLAVGSLYMALRLGCKKLFLTLPVYIPLVILSLYNNVVQYRLLAGTEILFLNEHMFVREIPETLKTTGAFPSLIIPIVAEYAVLAILIAVVIKSINSLGFLRDKETVSIFQILLAISGLAFFASSAYAYLGQFIRTTYTFITNEIATYVKYDSILALSEWASIISFILMLYFAYKYGSDVIARVKANKEDSEY